MSKARSYVTARTQINKSVVYFIVRRNVKFGYSKCLSVYLHRDEIGPKSPKVKLDKSVLMRKSKTCKSR